MDVPLNALRLLLRPVAPITVLIIFYSITESTRSTILDNFRCSSRQFHVTVVIVTLLGILSATHQFLNLYASRNWILRPPSCWKWDFEIAVVTGGSSGIGEAIVEGLLRKGVRVAILDVQKPPANLASNPDLHYYECDVSSQQAVAEAAMQIRSDLGDATILINNAAIGAEVTTVENANPDRLSTLFSINVLSHWYTLHEFLPYMLTRNKGHIVSTASMASFSCLPYRVDYGATKAAVMALYEGLGHEIREAHKTPGVLVTVVYPNYVSTPLLAHDADRLARIGIQCETAKQVADPVLARIWERRGGRVVFPPHMEIAASVRGWPEWMRILLMDVVGKQHGKPSPP